MSVPRDVSRRCVRRGSAVPRAELAVIAALGALSLCALAPAYVDPTIAIAVLAPLALGITWRNGTAEKRARRHLHVVDAQGVTGMR